MPGVPKKCTGLAVRAEFEINVAGGNPEGFSERDVQH